MFQQQQQQKIVNFMEISWHFVCCCCGIESLNGTAQKATKIKSKKKIIYIVYAI